MVYTQVSLGLRVYNIATQFNIEQTKVHSIINSYIEYCKESLASGRRVVLLGLVTIEPNEIFTKHQTTLAYECDILAKSIGLPSYTVYAIVKAYIDACIEDIMQGKDVVIRGLVALKTFKEPDGGMVVHSVISNCVRDYLIESKSRVASVRCHTHKVLKNNLSKRWCEHDKENPC